MMLNTKRRIGASFPSIWQCFTSDVNEVTWRCAGWPNGH